MRVQSSTTMQGGVLGFDFIADGLAVVEAAGYVRLLYANRHDNRISALTLASGQAGAAGTPGGPQSSSSPGADLALQDNAGSDRVYVFSAFDGLLRHAKLGGDGMPGFTNSTSTSEGFLYGVTAMDILDRGATDHAVVAQRNLPGLRIFAIDEGGAVTLLSSLVDGAKSYLGDVSDLTALTVAGRSFVMAASATENGLSLYDIAADGSASLSDALGAAEGLPIAGPVALQAVQIGQTHYVVVGSTVSASISVIRVNDGGVMFLADHLIDDRTTRFDNLAALDVFVFNGRAFVVAAGTDAGLSVVELLPGGKLSTVFSHAMETGTGLANVTGLETAVIGASVLVLMTDARGDRIHQVSLALDSLGGLIVAAGGLTSGSGQDDRMLGNAAADTLQGGAGADFLHDGAGADLLTGGAGADVFVFARDGAADRISDFQPGEDRLDVSDWGRIYTAGALSITATATGASVSYGAESLSITSAAGGPLILTDADFLF